MASQTGQIGLGQYPEQIVIMTSTPMRNRIEREAKAHRLSKSEVARTYIEAGMKAADENVEA